MHTKQSKRKQRKIAAEQQRAMEQQAQDANSGRLDGVAEHALSFLDKLEAVADFAAVQQLYKDGQEQDPALQKQYICTALHKLYGFEPRPGQIEGVWQTIFACRDLILIAKTSFGKSVLLQAPSAIVPNSTSLLILPLDKIGEEQYEKIARFPQARPCLLKRDTVTSALLEDVKAGKYTHVLLGPEQALSQEFRKVIRDPHFQKRLVMVAIDEAHLISQWGDDFRKDYAHLVALRGLISQTVPILACSATMDASTLKKVIQTAGFKPDVRIIRTSIDRPEISYIVQQLEPRTISRFTGLYFALDGAIDSNKNPTPLNIVKTVIFIDSRANIQKAMQLMRSWLNQKCPQYTAEIATKVIQPYFSTTSKHDKERIYQEFRKEDSTIRIVIATESLALGIDVPNVKRVIQYRFPIIADLAVLYQRWGRASRAAGIEGEAIWLVEPWAFGEKDHPQRKGKEKQGGRRSSGWPQEAETMSESESQQSDVETPVDKQAASNTTNYTRKKKKTALERRTALPDVIYKFLNSNRCLRSILLEFFEEALADPMTKAPLPPSKQCCSHCNPEILCFTPFPTPQKPVRVPRNSPRSHVLADINAWCEDEVKKLIPGSKFRLPTSALLSDELVTELAWKCDEIDTLDDLTNIVSSDWMWLTTHGQSLVDNIKIWLTNGRAKYEAKVAADQAKKDAQKAVAEAQAAALEATPKMRVRFTPHCDQSPNKKSTTPRNLHSANPLTSQSLFQDPTALALRPLLQSSQLTVKDSTHTTPLRPSFVEREGNNTTGTWVSPRKCKGTHQGHRGDEWFSS